MIQHQRQLGNSDRGSSDHQMAPSGRPYLRARRRVRQRVDAGEPRNSYSSIPGYSFRSGHGHLPFNSRIGGNGQQHLAAAAAAAHFHAAAAARQQQQFRSAQQQQQQQQQQQHHHQAQSMAQFYRMQQQLHHNKPQLSNNNVNSGASANPRSSSPKNNSSTATGSTTTPSDASCPPHPPPPPPLHPGHHLYQRAAHFSQFHQNQHLQQQRDLGPHSQQHQPRMPNSNFSLAGAGNNFMSHRPAHYANPGGNGGAYAGFPSGGPGVAAAWAMHRAQFLLQQQQRTQQQQQQQQPHHHFQQHLQHHSSLLSLQQQQQGLRNRFNEVSDGFVQNREHQVDRRSPCSELYQQQSDNTYDNNNQSNNRHNADPNCSSSNSNGNRDHEEDPSSSLPYFSSSSPLKARAFAAASSWFSLNGKSARKRRSSEVVAYVLHGFNRNSSSSHQEEYEHASSEQSDQKKKEKKNSATAAAGSASKERSRSAEPPAIMRSRRAKELRRLQEQEFFSTHNNYYGSSSSSKGRRKRRGLEAVTGDAAYEGAHAAAVTATSSQAVAAAASKNGGGGGGAAAAAASDDLSSCSKKDSSQEWKRGYCSAGDEEREEGEEEIVVLRRQSVHAGAAAAVAARRPPNLGGEETEGEEEREKEEEEEKGEGAAAAARRTSATAGSKTINAIGESLSKESDVTRSVVSNNKNNQICCAEEENLDLVQSINNNNNNEDPKSSNNDSCVFRNNAAASRDNSSINSSSVPYPHLTPKPFSRLSHSQLHHQGHHQPQQLLGGYHPGYPPHPSAVPPHGSAAPNHAQFVLREILNGKLALAAAVAQRQFFHSDKLGTTNSTIVNNKDISHSTPPLDKAMDPGVGVVTPSSLPRDFSSNKHNNNDQLKESAAASIMSHFLKVRQEMALNMSMDNIATPAEEEESSSPIHNNSGDDNDDLDEEEALDLQAQAKADRNGNHNSRSEENNAGGTTGTADGRNSAQSANSEIGVSPRSPSSDAGMSSSSGKGSKTARLESIVSSMRSSSSPLPGAVAGSVNGCKKRKLYQPMQHETSPGNRSDEGGNENSIAEVVATTPAAVEEKNSDEPERKRKKEIENLRDMHHHLQRLHHQRFVASLDRNGNDENTDPSTEKRREQLLQEQQQLHQQQLQHREQQHREQQQQQQQQMQQQQHQQNQRNNASNNKPKFPNPFLNLAAAGGHGQIPFSLPQVRDNMTPMQVQYVEMARRLMQEQQDKLTKEAITKEIMADTIGNNCDIAEKLMAISPELKGLADILKTEITASLAVIIDSIVGRFLQSRRQNNPAPIATPKPFSLDDPLGLKQNGPNTVLPAEHPIMSTPPPPVSSGRGHGHSGRAPQVRDRAAPRISSNPISLANPNPLSLNQTINTPASTNKQPSLASSLRQTAQSTPSLQDLVREQKDAVAAAAAAAAAAASQRQISSPSVSSDITRDDDSESVPEQDEALSLVVTPKKRRHKVTDSRIAPRTGSASSNENQPRRTEDSPASIISSKAAAAAAAAAAATGRFPPLPFPNALGTSSSNADSPSPRPSPAGAAAALFPGLTPPAGLAGLPNAAALHDFPHFSPFYAAAAASLTPRVSSAGAQPTTTPGSPSPSSEKNLRRNNNNNSSSSAARATSSVDRELESPHHSGLPHSGPLLSHATAASPDYLSNLREASETAQEEFERVQAHLPFSLSSYSLEAHSATLTPMHLRKAKLMFFWVRYPSSAILKMFFPDIKFNKNNTAQLVKWFSNFREFYYIQMEKYARQALSEGIKNPEDIHVNMDSELYRVINLHYNRNNHIEVPDHFLPVVEATLREFFAAVRDGKDSESSWKKQIYKIIARFDEAIPDYFKTQEFLKQLE